MLQARSVTVCSQVRSKSLSVVLVERTKLRTVLWPWAVVHFLRRRKEQQGIRVMASLLMHALLAHSPDRQVEVERP